MNMEKSRSPDWDHTTLAAAIALMGGMHGVDISVYDDSFLMKSLEKRRRATDCGSIAAYLHRLADDAMEQEAFYASLQVTYSEFFRNPMAFALLEQLLLPTLVEAKARTGQAEIRIWSAACAAGQEVWSVAILLDALSAAWERTVPFRIFATDLSERNLALARAGVYSAAAVGNVRLRHLDGWFTRQGEYYAIIPRLKEWVEFSVYDLLNAETSCPPGSIFGDFDLILCSNVLLYYRPEAQRFILDKMRRCLAAGGHLITDESEWQIVENAGGFRAAAPPAAVFRRVSHSRRE
jgi:chemotaxis protein methyltransferase CheR